MAAVNFSVSELGSMFSQAVKQIAAINSNGDLSAPAKERQAAEVRAAAKASAVSLVKSRVSAAEAARVKLVKERDDHADDFERGLNFARLSFLATETMALARTAIAQQGLTPDGGLTPFLEGILEGSDYYKLRALRVALPELVSALQLGNHATDPQMLAIVGMATRVEARLLELEPMTLRLDRDDAQEAIQGVVKLRREISAASGTYHDIFGDLEQAAYPATWVTREVAPGHRIHERVGGNGNMFS